MRGPESWCATSGLLTSRWGSPRSVLPAVFMWKATWHFLQTSRVLIFSRGIDPARPQFGHARSIIEMLPNRMDSRAHRVPSVFGLSGGYHYSVLRSHDACKGIVRARARMVRFGDKVRSGI